jgi:hypothetical protein
LLWYNHGWSLFFYIRQESEVMEAVMDKDVQNSNPRKAGSYQEKLHQGGTWPKRRCGYASGDGRRIPGNECMEKKSMHMQLL